MTTATVKPMRKSNATGQKRPRNSPEEFIRAWHKFEGNAKDIAEELGISPTSVTVRASNYRQLGVKLPKATRQGNGRRLDVDELNALVDDVYSHVPHHGIAHHK